MRVVTTAPSFRPSPSRHCKTTAIRLHHCSSYVGNKESTAEILLLDGWLKTGNLCYFDVDACLYIVDRLKELIKYKGYQVPPAKLERLLLLHPDITDAAVISGSGNPLQII